MSNSFDIGRKKLADSCGRSKFCLKMCQSGTAVTEGFYIVKKYVQHSHEPQMPRKNKFTDDIWKISGEKRFWFLEYFRRTLAKTSVYKCVVEKKKFLIIIIKRCNAIIKRKIKYNREQKTVLGIIFIVADRPLQSTSVNVIKHKD